MINDYSPYEKLRKRVRAVDIAEDSVNTQFIFEGNSSIDVIINGEKYKLAIVLKEDKDAAYIYTVKERPLVVGSCFAAKGLHFLIYKKDTFIKNVRFKRYEALLANVELAENVWGYFKSPETSYINTKIEDEAVEVSLQHPILVAPAGLFEIGDKFTIKGRPWQVIETDTISSDEVTYYSLRATTIEKTIELEGKDAAENEPEEEVLDGFIEVSPLQTIQVSTEHGSFYATAELVDVKLKVNSATFTVPFGIDEFEVIVFENGYEKTIKYKVV